MKKIYHYFPAEQVQKPGYDISHVSTGIVHLGFGAFHRAHQALYTDETMTATGRTDWGIAAASLRSGQNLINSLKQQDYWYTVIECDGHNRRQIKLVGAVIEAMSARDDPQPLLCLMTKASTRIITLTITEKGYCLDPVSHQLNIGDPDVQHDIDHPANPKSAIGFLVEALNLRYQTGVPAFSVLSCDNIPDNGKKTRLAVIQLAKLTKPELAQWIAGHVRFPSSLADRIVPAISEQELTDICVYLGADDQCAVITEPYRQWIIEDDFSLGRPEWDLIDGVQFVEDVTPWQTMKLRMLNGSHSLLAYLGGLAGYQTIADAINDDRLAYVVRYYLNREATPSLQIPCGVNAAEYAQHIMIRFANQALQHRTDQVASDGSQKLPIRWFPQLEVLVLSQQGFNCIALGIAAWLRYLDGIDDQNNSIKVCDPLTKQLQQLKIDNTSFSGVSNIIRQSGLFPACISQSPTALGRINYYYAQLQENGVLSTLEEFQQCCR